jgi:N6-L-threonylcarbamoyladenine synthase
VKDLVLGLETSCDETGASVLIDSRICSNATSTQLVHSRFGGVVPELAARAHIRILPLLVQTALEVAGVESSDLNLIAVAYKPGLVGALLTGISFAKGLALALGIPFIGVDHLDGHIHSLYLSHPDLHLPFLGLVISGGHTELLEIQGPEDYRRLGSTLDDACGEAFDKVAKLLGLPYPGGPALEELARQGEPSIAFPQPRVAGYDFSFAGLKTAVLYYLRDHPAAVPADVASSFQATVINLLISKLTRAIRETGLKRVGVSGGVAANSKLRVAFKELEAQGIEVFFPRPELCTDNAAMIAAAGRARYQLFGPSPLSLAVQARP